MYNVNAVYKEIFSTSNTIPHPFYQSVKIFQKIRFSTSLACSNSGGLDAGDASNSLISAFRIN